MTPKLQAAVERYRQHKAAVYAESPYAIHIEGPIDKYVDWDREQMDRDLRLLADAFVAGIEGDEA